MKWFRYGAVGFGGLLVAAALVLWGLGQRADAGRQVARVEIAQPREAVWAWLMEPDRFKQWVSWTVEVREERDRRVVVMQDPNMGGQRVEFYSKLLAERKPESLEVEITAPMGFDGRMAYRLTESAPGRTRLEIDARFRYHHWFAALMEPLVTPQAQAKLDADLATLKRLAEQTPVPAGAR